jgi:hypothetical protein
MFTTSSSRDRSKPSSSAAALFAYRKNRLTFPEESLEDFIKNHEINPEDLFDPELEKKQQKQNTQIARSKWIAR